MKKIFWFQTLGLLLVSTMQAIGPNLTSFVTRCGEFTIEYSLPGGANYLSGRPSPVVDFPTHREFPLSGGIAAVGWGFIKEIAQVQLSVSVMKISKPRFGSSVVLSEWEQILREEKMSYPLPGKKKQSRIFSDNAQLEWLETIVETKDVISARSYLRPIAPDLVFLVSLNLGSLATEEQRIEALQVQSRILEFVVIKKS